MQMLLPFRQLVCESSLTANKPLPAERHKTARASGFQSAEGGLLLLCSVGVSAGRQEKLAFIHSLRAALSSVSPCWQPPAGQSGSANGLLKPSPF